MNKNQSNRTLHVLYTCMQIEMYTINEKIRDACRYTRAVACIKEIFWVLSFIFNFLHSSYKRENAYKVSGKIKWIVVV